MKNTLCLRCAAPSTRRGSGDSQLGGQKRRLYFLFGFLGPATLGRRKRQSFRRLAKQTLPMHGAVVRPPFRAGIASLELAPGAAAMLDAEIRASLCALCASFGFAPPSPAVPDAEVRVPLCPLHAAFEFASLATTMPHTVLATALATCSVWTSSNNAALPSSMADAQRRATMCSFHTAPY